jgi:hypothetical protein
MAFIVQLPREPSAARAICLSGLVFVRLRQGSSSQIIGSNSGELCPAGQDKINSANASEVSTWWSYNFLIHEHIKARLGGDFNRVLSILICSTAPFQLHPCARSSPAVKEAS